MADEIVEIFRNRGRAGIGLGYSMSAKWRFSFNLSLQTSRVAFNEDRTVTDYIYQIKIRRHFFRPSEN